MPSCPWCGDQDPGHSRTKCLSNPYLGQIKAMQSDFSTAIGLQAVSGIPDKNSSVLVHIVQPSGPHVRFAPTNVDPRGTIGFVFRR